MAGIRLEFLPNDANEGEGLNDAGVETYMDSPYASMAREIGQNSSDAGISNPVKIKFDLLEVNIDDLPAPGKLLDIVESCLEKSVEDGGEKEIDFFSKAYALLKNGKIAVLRTADFNTTGLRGPCVEGAPFHALVKSTGVNNKQKEDSGGSFGIGKNAAIAVSDVRTVLYSTSYEENGVVKFLFQGKSLLISHTGKDGNPYRSRGYWGLPGYEPVEDFNEVPDWLRRDEQGTSIFSIGFREVENWQYQMALSLIINFFVAIHRGAMEFRLNDGEIEINKETLPALFKDEGVVKAAEDSSQEENFEYAGFLYDCLTSEETKEEILDIKDLGRIRMLILSRDDLPKRLTIIRNDMIITDSLEKFGDKFASFRMYKGFVALVEPLDNFGSALIKQLENSKHDALSAERITKADKKAKAVKAMRKLAKLIRETIKSETLKEPEQVIPLDEMAVFFADPDDLKKDTEADHNPEFYTYSARITKPSKPALPKLKEGDEGGGAPVNDGGNGGEGWNPGDGGGHGAGSGSTGSTSKKKSVAIGNVRNVIPEDGGETKRVIWFTPEEGGVLTVSVLGTGINSNDQLIIAESSTGEVSKGSVSIIADAGERHCLELTLTDHFKGPIELVAYTEIKEEKTDAN